MRRGVGKMPRYIFVHEGKRKAYEAVTCEWMRELEFSKDEMSF